MIASIQTHSDPEEARKRAMNDPEVQKILNDPSMRMILEQMQNDPAAIQVSRLQGDSSARGPWLS